MGNVVPDTIEAYLASLNRLADPVLEEIARQGRAQNLPLIDAEVGALLQVLAHAVGARRILEIGTAIGYSTLWLARALPADGLLLSIEQDADRAAAARANLERAGVADRTTVMIGDSARLAHKVAGPFDLIFNDGDKHQYEPLLDRLVTLLRPGGLLITDNVLWSGRVVPGFQSESPDTHAETTAAIARYNTCLAGHPELKTAFVPLRDGLSISVRR